MKICSGFLIKLTVAAFVTSLTFQSYAQSNATSGAQQTISNALNELRPSRSSSTEDGSGGNPFNKLDQLQPASSRVKDYALPNDPFAAAEKEIAADKLYKAGKRELAKQTEEAQELCKANFDAQKQCMLKTCPAEPRKQVCVRQQQDSTGGCKNASGSCYVFRTSSCVEYGPNPEYKEWQACVTAPPPSVSSCVQGGRAIESIENCVSETLAMYKSQSAVEAGNNNSTVDIDKNSTKYNDALSLNRNYNNYLANPRKVMPNNLSSRREGDRRDTAPIPDKGNLDKDITEPEHNFRGRVWLEGGGRRRPTSSRAEACQQAERDREETIRTNARDPRDKGIEERSDCTCNYKASSKEWYCRVFMLPVGHSARGNLK